MLESKKSKDPAFLFYSKDYYEGTRMMTPEERACYIDLLIYQHQNGYIPNDTKRLSLYCSGCSEATLIATLEAKFKLYDKGWLNTKLNDVVLDRQNFSSVQSVNGIIGQFYKSAKKELKANEYAKLKAYLESNFTRELLAERIAENKANLKGLREAMLIASLKHIEDANAIGDEDKYYIKFNHLKITIAEHNKLLEKGYTEVQVKNVYDKIQNYSKNNKYKSLYLTSLDWLKREYGEVEPIGSKKQVLSIADQMEAMRNG